MGHSISDRTVSSHLSGLHKQNLLVSFNRSGVPVQRARLDFTIPIIRTMVAGVEVQIPLGKLA